MVAALAALVIAAGSGAFDALSLAVEAHARADAVQAALLRHALLAAGALALALAVVLPLAWWGFWAPRAAGAIGAVFGGVQVVPSLALFGLLIPLLSLLLAAVPALRAAGLQAIGPTPALLAVAAYLALPLWRAVLEGFGAADPAAVEAARAMGMGEMRIAREVRLPLGLPVFAAGLRVAAVQAIGLMTLGGLVGAGGLGALVFEGMSQLAADLILLGALPIIGLALAADLTLAALARRLGT
jgi:osmoprotectant transport system permease protein